MKKVLGAVICFFCSLASTIICAKITISESASRLHQLQLGKFARFGVSNQLVFENLKRFLCIFCSLQLIVSLGSCRHFWVKKGLLFLSWIVTSTIKQVFMWIQLVTSLAIRYPLYSWVGWNNESAVPCSKKQQQTAPSGDQTRILCITG